MARILLIDDEHMVRAMVADALGQYGHSLRTARNGEEGLEYFRREPFDLVITDIHMPGMGGARVIKAIRELAPSIPLIVCGGDTIPDIEADTIAEQLGADRMIRKPFALEELNNAIAQLLADAR